MLCGGPSPEYEVSLSSGRGVTLALDRGRYAVRPVCVRRNGDWWLARQEFGEADDPSKLKAVFESFAQEEPDQSIEVVPPQELAARMNALQPDCALNMIHGEFGEDGSLQALLELLGLPCTGSDALASTLTMDKSLTQALLARRGIPVPAYLAVEYSAKAEAGLLSEALDQFGLPCFIKPGNTGSSVGVHRVETPEQFPEALRDAAQYSKVVMIEQAISGVEVSCGVLERIGDGGSLERVAFPPTEIVPRNAAFFNYEAKYVAGMTDEITPARLPEDAMHEVQRLAVETHTATGCEGFSRVDMIVQDGQPYVIEINTVPGMTPTSLLPAGAAAHGISMTQLMDHFIQHAWHRANRV